MIAISIDVTLLDKTKFKRVTRKNGKEAVFCDLVLIETPGGQFGDWICKQSQTNEERAAGTKTDILGNGKNLGQRSAAPPPNEPEPTPNDDTPF